MATESTDRVDQKRLLGPVRRESQKLFANQGQQFWMPIWWFFSSLKLSKDQKKSYDFMVKILDTPMKVQCWMTSNLKYNWLNIFDYWQTPQETFQRRSGDCEDWALFANACLWQRIPSYILLMFRKDKEGTQYGHAAYLGKTRYVDPVWGPADWVSLGTYGMMKHYGEVEDVVPDFQKYESWTKLILLDHNLVKLIEKWR